MARYLSAAELKAAKEAFVTGHTGTSFAEPCLLLLRQLVARSHVKTRQAMFFVEALVLLLPTLLVLTTAAVWAPALIMGVLCISGALEAYQRVRSKLGDGYLRLPWQSYDPSVSAQVTQRLAGAKLPFLTHYRGGMLLITIICILAVDFPVFPRRFAKCERHGVSIMDAGVGSFVFSGALVSSQARKLLPRHSPSHIILAALKQSAAVLTLGFIRFVVNKSVNYQEHVSEYGVHWNFFITLAAVTIMAALLEAAAATTRHSIPTAGFVIIGVAVVVAYEVALHVGQLQSFIFEAERDTLFQQNREGVCSLAGFFAIFTFGIAVGRCIHAKKRSIHEWNTLLSCLIVIGVVALGCAASLHQAFPVSRRLTNASYVLWMVAYNTLQLAALCCIDLMWVGPRRSESTHAVSCVLHGLNANGLPMFLLANVATGAVNMSVTTLFTPNHVGFAIVAAYVLVVCACGVGLSLLSTKPKPH